MPVNRNVLPPLREPTGLTFPSIEREMLPNGVRLCTIAHDQPGLVNLVVLLRAGSATDPSGYEGLAGLTASLLDEGCAKYSTVDLHKALGDIGGRLYTTAMCAMTLEVYYRYMPLYEKVDDFPL